MNEQVKELFDTLMCNYDFPEEFAAGLAEFIIDEEYSLIKHGTWKLYSSTMMECSNCKKHVPYHRYKYCPHCGSKNIMEAYNG